MRLPVERMIQLCMLAACCIAGIAGEDLGEGGASDKAHGTKSCLSVVGSII